MLFRSENDYQLGVSYPDPNGSFGVVPHVSPAAGELGSSCFAMAVSLETSSGIEISGLNAEEQSDISLQATWSANAWSLGGYNLEVYTFYDAMLVLRENNVLELIQ